MSKSIFITTSIPYVNSKPHVGHAQEFVLADCLARSYRELNEKVVFQTGTDENAFKNVIAANAAGVSPKEFVDKNADIFRSLVYELDISIDTFIRTTEARHWRGVEKFWSLLKPDDIYTKSYKGLYCIGCEDFYLERDLVNGVCPDHRSRPEEIEEENIFFKLSNYQSALEELIQSDRLRIYPESRKNEALSFIRQGLHDISLTRAKWRSPGWGIPVPNHPDQIVYVWIDALVNYLSGQGFGESDQWENVWNEETKKIHVIGKNVWKFHAIYWPALLLSADLPLPNEIVVHGFLTNDGVKISKSLGNTIDPIEVSTKYGVDAVRHLLLGCTPIFSDSDFSTARLNKAYVDDLAHRLGNLYSRLIVLCEKANFKRGPFAGKADARRLERLVTEFNFQEYSRVCWQEIDSLNADINHQRPWELLKAGDSLKLHHELDVWCRRLFSAALSLRPFIPRAVDKILHGLNSHEEPNRILFPPLT
jgi:methionyl-tRNA synthetase